MDKRYYSRLSELEKELEDEYFSKLAREMAAEDDFVAVLLKL